MGELRWFNFRGMGSPCTLHLYDAPGASADSVADECIREVGRLECKYSRFRDDSLLSQINRSAGSAEGVEVDEETASLLDYAATAYEQSGGLFDVTSGVLRRVWDFKSGRVPSQAAIDETLQQVGWHRIAWQRPRLVLPEAGMELDFGGFVKEYAADRLAELCRSRGIRHGLIDLGGDLCVVGPHPDDTPWRVGIRHPRRPETAMATVPLRRGGIASSGDYERYMVVDGVRYGHILDPTTGWPVDSLQSVSVVSSHCLVSGTATTVAMLMGPDGAAWLDALGLPNLRRDASGKLSGTLLPGDEARSRTGAGEYEARYSSAG